MRGLSSRETVTTTATLIFECRVADFHSLLLRPRHAMEVSFFPFTYGQGVTLAASETFNLTWQDFRPDREEQPAVIQMYAAVAASTGTVDVAGITR
jgi:hypothetical protein